MAKCDLECDLVWCGGVVAWQGWVPLAYGVQACLAELKAEGVLSLRLGRRGEDTCPTPNCHADDNPRQAELTWVLLSAAVRVIKHCPIDRGHI